MTQAVATTPFLYVGFGPFCPAVWQAQSDICLPVAMPVHNSTLGVHFHLHLPITSFSTLLYERACFRNRCTLNIGDKWVEGLSVIGKPCVLILVRTPAISAAGWETGELWVASRHETISILLRSVRTASDVRPVPY